jgi:hypothetical protein
MSTTTRLVPTLVVLALAPAMVGLLACDERAARASPAAPRVEPATPVDPLDCGPVLASQRRGIAFAHSTRHGGYGSRESRASLEELAALGVDSITLIPFGWMEALDATEVVLNTSGRGESDASLRAATAQAQALGIEVVMKPHLWLRGGAWVGEVALPDEPAWDAWFASYTRFIVHYAALAEELALPLLVVGVELRATTAAQPQRWREVIRAARDVYSGPITYAANWDEAEHVTFWDALDYVGVQMWAPLAPEVGATRDELERNARANLAQYVRLAESVGRPLLLTEVGFRANADAAVRPWTWPTRGDDVAATARDHAAQADAYCAIVRTFGRSPHVAGMYWWKWFSNAERDDGPRGFSPRGRPALSVLRHAFSPGSPPPSP